MTSVEKIPLQNSSPHISHHNLPVKLLIYPAVIFMVIGMLIGTFLAFNTFIFADYFAGEYIHFGRLRPVHVGHVLFLWLLSANAGIFYFLIPRLCGTPLWSPRLAYVSIAFWWGSLVPAIYSYPWGTNFGWEYAEIPYWLGWLPVKAMFYFAWLLFATNLFMTIFNRKYEKMYVSLWYAMGVLVWASFTFIVGGFAVNWVPEGISRVNTSFFYVHNLVGLIFTPMGVAIAYYSLPKLANTPIYSHKMSMLGFWSVAFVYAWVGAHHIIHGPVSQWLQTTSILFSIWLFIPVWTVVTNLFATLKDRWDLYSKSAAIRFLMVGNAYYLLICIQGPLMALRNINEITSKTDWVIGHSHASLYATFTYFTLAGIYFVIPVITGKPWWSKRLADLHFSLNVWGSIPFILPLWIGGYIQGLLWATWSDGTTYAEFHKNLANMSFIDTNAEMYWWWMLRGIGGLMILTGNLFFLTNLYNTVLFAPKEPLKASEVPP